MIHGYFDPDKSVPTPRILLAVILPERSTVSHKIEFVIDTGASTTCLHPLDAVRAGITIDELDQSERWTRPEIRGGVGGAARYYAISATYVFADDNRDPFELPGEIRVAQFTHANAELPSLLGWDVLRHFRMTMDWGDKGITLAPAL